jgi:hypothetical protein
VRGFFGFVVAIGLLATVSDADAAQRYASPDGSGILCSQAAPCSLEEAVTKAESNDEVIVGAGTYSPGATVEVPAGAINVEIHGDLGGPMPKISTSLLQGPIVLGAEGRLKYLDIENQGGAAIGCFHGTSVERVRVKDVAAGGVGIYQTSDCVVRDSLVRAEGEDSVALRGFGLNGDATGVVRNITAIATGPGSVAIMANFEEQSSGSYTLNVKNSIAGGEGVDLAAIEGGLGPGKIVISNSNFATSKVTGSSTVTDSGANQTPSPLFADAANGDYREAAGSPTIDAGTVSQLGALDLAGSARVLGPAPDIGAYEFVPHPSELRSIAGELRSITFKPPAFRAANFGGAVISAKKKPTPPVGSTVIYNLSSPATVDFSLERRATGRRVGGKCKTLTKANRSKKRCTFYGAIKGGFSVNGTAPLNNSFRFSGRVDNRALKPGTYRLVGRCGTSLKRGLFKIIR